MEEKNIIEIKNIYEFIDVLRNICEEKGWIMIKDIHIHEDGYDYAERVRIVYENNEFIRETSLSGGAQESVWNTYESYPDTFMHHFGRTVNINNIDKLSDAIYTAFVFLKRHGYINWEELRQIDKNLCEYCNTRA